MQTQPLLNIFCLPPPEPEPRFTPPTIEMCLLEATKAGMPEIEAHKFWLYYDSKGWRVGRANKKMEKWRSSLALWRLKWQEEQALRPKVIEVLKKLDIRDCL